ncbi:MAG TPA: hypothetical protein VF824_08905 [Thermoanaerobaculia bacterium]|jgi:hypothetical protein
MTRKSRIFLGITTVLTLLAAAFALGTTRQRTEVMDHLTPPTITHTDPVISDMDARALADMQTLARREFGQFRIRQNSFGSSELYSPDHLLHWMTIEHHGYEIYLYHLTEKARPEVRHTAVWSTHEPFATPWQPVW